MDILPVLYTIIAAVSWATTGVFVTNLSKFGITSNEITLSRLIVAAVILTVITAVKDKNLLKIRPKHLPFYILNGLCLFGTSAFYYAAMVKTTVSTAVTLMYTAPMLVTAFSAMFLGEKLTAKKVTAVILTFIGCGLVTGIIGDMKLTGTGIICGILSGISYAGYSITAKINMNKGINPSTSTVYCFIFAAIAAVIFTNPAQAAVKTTSGTIPLILSIANGIVTTVIPYYFYTKSLKKLSAGTASAMSTVEPLTATLISVIFFNEKLTVYSALGIILILVSVIMLGVSANNNAKESVK